MRKMFLSFATVLTLGLSVSAQLYDQTIGVTGNGAISTYMTDNDTLVQCADDFTIPNFAIWDITSVTVQGFRNDSGANMTEMTVEIFTDAGGPGALVYSGLHTIGGVGITAPVSDTAITLTIPTQSLSAGTYWLSVYGYAESSAPWYWTTHGPDKIDSNAMLIDSDDYFGAGITAWTPLPIVGLVAPDLAFQIGGALANTGLTQIDGSVITVYPNPAIDVLNIDIESTEINRVIILNISGEIVHTVYNPSTQINISELVSGVYFIEITTADGIARTQFIKK